MTHLHSGKRLRKIYLTISAFSLSALSVSAFGQSEERLFPSEQAKQISVTTRNDGRVLYMNLKNNSNYVITDARISCWISATKEQIEEIQRRVKACNQGQFAGNCPLAGFGGYQHLASFKGKLFPHKTAEIYSELNQIPGEHSCSLGDVRGYEKGFFDF